MTSGQKQTVTFRKCKKQKRLFLDTLGNLYNKFQSEHKESIGFTTFWRLKPFWVRAPSEKDRETCLCKTCESVSFMAEVLYRHGVIKTSVIDVLVKEVVCSPDNILCMHGKCQKCKRKEMVTVFEDYNLEVVWKQWRTDKE